MAEPIHRRFDSPREAGEYKIEPDVIEDIDGRTVEIPVFAVYFRKYEMDLWEPVECFETEIDAIAYVKNEIEGDMLVKCDTVGDLRRALERLPDDCLVNTVEDSTILGECVHVRHDKGSDYVDVGVIDNDRTRGK